MWSQNIGKRPNILSGISEGTRLLNQLPCCTVLGHSLVVLFFHDVKQLSNCIQQEFRTILALDMVVQH